jgi:hypothetical protein
MQGYVSKKVITDSTLISRLAQVFDEINKDSTADKLAASKANQISKKLRFKF